MLSDALVEAEEQLTAARDTDFYAPEIIKRADHILCEMIKLRLELDCAPGSMNWLQTKNPMYLAVAAGDFSKFANLVSECNQLGQRAFFMKYGAGAIRCAWCGRGISKPRQPCSEVSPEVCRRYCAVTPDETCKSVLQEMGYAKTPPAGEAF
jgi:hypothetical protein